MPDDVNRETEKELSGIAKTALNAGRELLKIGRFITANALKILLFIAAGLLILSLFITLIEEINREKADEDIYNSGLSVHDANYDASQILTSVFYTKYSDQSFYYTLSEPSEEQKQDEANFSGKTYEELEGIKSRGITQASYENYIQDIDGFEENVKVGTGILSILDADLNKAGDTGYYNPEQLIKMVYTGEDCNVNSEDFDFDKCKLGDLKEASSTKYVTEDGAPIGSTSVLNKTEEKEEGSMFDYGLGSLVHYQAYYQPSRVADYDIADIEYIDDDWSYDGTVASSPLQKKSWSSLSSSEQSEILSKYGFMKNLFADERSESLDGTVEGTVDWDGNHLGIYQVSDTIVYKDWAPAYYNNFQNNEKYFALDPKEWGSKEPLISTGVLDTNVVYVIDKAITWYGKIDYNVSQRWTDFGEATHDQDLMYLKDYNSNQSAFNEDFKTKNPWGTEKIEPLIRIVNSSQNVEGYAKETPHWVSGEFSAVDCSETITYSTEEAKEICGASDGPYFSNTAERDACIDYWSNQVKDTIKYTCATRTAGHWETSLTRDRSGNKVDGSQTYEAEPAGVSYENRKFRGEVSDIPADLRDVDAGKNNNDARWTAQPSYVFNISAKTTGTLQVLLASHNSPNIETPGGYLTYLTNYIKNYRVYIPSEDTSFACYQSTTKEDIDYAMPDVQFKYNVNLSACTEEEFALATNPSSSSMRFIMPSNYFTIHSDKIKNVLGIIEANNKENQVVEYSTDWINVNKTINEETRDEIVDLLTQYKRELKTTPQKYGIDPNLIVSIIHAANNTPNLTGYTCDGNCILSDVKVLGDGLNVSKKETITSSVSAYMSSFDLIKYTSAKMQLLLEKYSGNLPIALLEYNIGAKATEKVLEVYEDQTGVPKEKAMTDQYDLGWYHFVGEVINNPSKYGVSLPSGANIGFVKNIIENMTTNRFIWNRRNDSFLGQGISSVVWNRYSSYDEQVLKNSKITNPSILKAIYNLRKESDDSEYFNNFEKYWKVLTFGQKKWENGVYVENNDDETAQHKYSTFESSPERGLVVKYSGTDNDITRTIKAALAKEGTNNYLEIDLLSPDLWMNMAGNMRVIPSYKDVIGMIERDIANEYSPMPKGDFIKEWKFETEEDVDIYSPVNGMVIVAGEDNVTIVSNEAFITFNNLKTVEVEVGEEPTDEPIGTSSGKVSVFVTKDGLSYTLGDFLEKWKAEQALASDEFFNMGSHYIGFWWGWDVLSYAELEAKWREIYEDFDAWGLGGGNGSAYRQCVTFTNWYVAKYIEDHNGIPVSWGGNGSEKIIDGLGGIPESYAKYFGSVENNVRGLVEGGKGDIVFSWGNTGSVGHTGIIESSYYSEEQGDYIIVISQANGHTGDIAYQNEMKLSEWESIYESKGTGYIRYSQLHAPSN